MDYDKKAAYWLEKDEDTNKMEERILKERIEVFISSHNTCALATADLHGFVRCTPIEYNYFDGCFYMFSEGGLKFKALKENKNVCLAIFDQFSGWNKLGGMQISGSVEMIEPYSDEYLKAMQYKKIPLAAMQKMTEPMPLIKVIPKVIDFLSSEFKADGCGNRQQIRYV